MRLLLQRHDHSGQSLVGPQSEPQRRRGQDRPCGSAVPLRRPQPDCARGSARGRGAREMTRAVLSRRRFAQSLGIVLAAFALPPGVAFGQGAAMPFSLRTNRSLEGWIRLEPDGTVMVFTGKAELGQ